MTVHTDGNIIVLPHWDTRPPMTCHPTQSHYPETELTSLALGYVVGGVDISTIMAQGTWQSDAVYAYMLWPVP